MFRGNPSRFDQTPAPDGTMKGTRLPALWFKSLPLREKKPRAAWSSDVIERKQSIGRRIKACYRACPNNF
jgi:hypothetical protein